MCQIWFYVPEAQCETVKHAMFAAGAGRIGKYDDCTPAYSFWKVETR